MGRALGDITRGRKLTQAVLIVIAGGAVLLTALIAPNALQLFRPFIRGQRRRTNEDRDRVQKALRRLSQRRFVAIEWKGDDAILTITQRGQRYIKRLRFEQLSVPKPSRWDEKWRLVIFDIPERFGTARRAFNAKLHELGFFQLQKSAFVSPYECRDELDFVCDFFHIRKFVQYIQTKHLDQMENTARRHYALPHV